MRTEEMEKEAALFDRKDECYIHIQRCSGGPFITITSGDPNIIFQAIVNLIFILEENYKISFDTTLKLLKRGRKRMLRHERAEKQAA